MKTSHFLNCYTSTQFSLSTEKTYIELINKYNIDKMDGFIKYKNHKFDSYAYNPQKTPGKPYKVNAHNTKKNVYGSKRIPSHENITGDRHPRSVIKCLQSGEKLHPTQKQVDLCEWLIKTYTNENDLVLIFVWPQGQQLRPRSNQKEIILE
jgi:DNA modification methylase